MCKDLEHGGARCPTDTSEARRHRRKASTILASSSTRATTEIPDAITPLVPISESMAKLKERAELLRQKVYGSVPPQVSQESWDQKNELRITALGIALGKEADKIAEYDPAALKSKIEAKGIELFSKPNKIIKELDAQDDEYSDQWYEVVDKYDFAGAGRFGVFYAQDLTDQQKEKLDDDEKKLVENIIALAQTRRTELEKFKDIDKEFESYKNKIYTEANQKLSAAYIEVLSQIRPLGGVKIKLSEENSDEGTQTILANTVGKNYPTAWLKQHNESEDSIHLKFDNDRAFYNAIAFSETEDDGIPKTILYANFVTVPTFADAKELENLYETDENNKTFIVETENLMGNKKFTVYVEAATDEIYDDKTHGVMVNGEPSGEGWVNKNTPAQLNAISKQNFTTDEQVNNFLKTKVWARPILTTKKSVKNLAIYSPEIGEKFNAREGSSYSLPEASAYHEFGHRMEEVLPDNVLPRHEKAFLARRANKYNKADWYKNMVSTGVASEFGHDAGLVVNYAGRDYFNDNNYEVFTIGVESLYGGNYGGLMGNDASSLKSDPDHRGFVLGTLASL